MDRLNTFFGHFIRRQDGPTLPIDIDIDLPLPRPSGTSSSVQSTTSSTTSVASSTFSSTASSTSSTTLTPLTTTTPTATDKTSSTISAPASSQTLAENSVILVQTIPVPIGGEVVTGTSQTLPPTNTEVSVVIENKTVTNSAKPSATSTLPEKAGAATTFMDNKVASGIVFGLCGLVGLILIGVLVWFGMRKRRRIKKLEEEIISFDPEDVGQFHHHRTDVETASVNSMEKARSVSSLDHYAGSGYATTMNVDSGEYRNASPYSDLRPQPQQPAQQYGVQRPGNVAFNPMGPSDLNRSKSQVHNPYPNPTFNR